MQVLPLIQPSPQCSNSTSKILLSNSDHSLNFSWLRCRFYAFLFSGSQRIWATLSHMPFVSSFAFLESCSIRLGSFLLVRKDCISWILFHLRNFISVLINPLKYSLLIEWDFSSFDDLFFLLRVGGQVNSLWVCTALFFLSFDFWLKWMHLGSLCSNSCWAINIHIFQIIYKCQRKNIFFFWDRISHCCSGWPEFICSPGWQCFSFPSVMNHRCEPLT